MSRTCFLLLLLCSSLFAEDSDSSDPLLPDVDEAIFQTIYECERLPITYNHLYTTGYFLTPSARIGEAGEIGVGVIHAPPYLQWNARIQPFACLDLSMNWRIFRGVKDKGLDQFGFGDYADRGANAKLELMTPEYTNYDLPGFAIGVEDFMGSKKFLNYYIVGTKIWLPQNIPLETSFGWGAGRFTNKDSRGFFGGLAWYPFFYSYREFLHPLSLCAEYDPIDYSNRHREPHPKGRSSHTPINYGVKYKYADTIDLTLGSLRGKELAYGGSIQYNWGSSKGFLPKIQDPLPYCAPADKEPLGCIRTESLFVHNLAFAFEEQGFRLFNVILLQDNTLVITLINECYREERISRSRIEHILGALLPSNIEKAVVVMESYGLPCQQYVYTPDLLQAELRNTLSCYEHDLLTPRAEAIDYRPNGKVIFDRDLDLWKARVAPRFETFFGNAKGKFKYDFGLRGNVEGYLPYNLFYDVELGYTLFSTANDIGIVDLYNPSQLPVVLTDFVRYRQHTNFTTDRAYLQRAWNLGRGYFSRLSLGYFMVNYAGLAGEFLWYPANSHLAVGFDGAALKKRRYHGLGFQSKLLQFDGFVPTFHTYSLLPQYFFNLYFDFPQISFFTKVSAGQFLAGDKGLRLEATRYFESGLRLTGWVTFTDAKDKVHGEDYYNRGIALELPLDLFYLCSSRRVWNYGSAAWLRDAGAFSYTGPTLFDIINRERR